MNNSQLIPEINRSLKLDIPVTASQQELMQQLSSYINNLISHDFQKLVVILYRVDVNEKKLMELLASNIGTNAGDIIAHLIIERQLEKIKSRQAFTRRDNIIDDEEKWND
jgi:hypothetical protein